MKFMESPYFNPNELLINYFKLIHAELRSGTIEINELSLANQAYAPQNLTTTQLLKINNHLMALVEEFLIQENFQSKKFVRANYLLESIIDNRYDLLYNTSVKAAKRVSERTLEKSSDFFHEKYRLSLLEFQKTGEFERKTKSKNQIEKFNFEETSKSLDEFYILEKLKLYCTLLSWQRVSKVEQNLDLIDEIELYLEEKKEDIIPQIKAFLLVSKTFKNKENLDYYFQLSELINAHISVFSEAEAKEVFDAIFNYCIQKINSGNTSFQQELFERYKDALENRVLLKNDILSPTSFRNICFLGLRLKQFEWIEYFIKNYAQNLPDKYRDNAVRYNLARLYFYQKKYTEVLEQLREVEYEDAAYNLNAKFTLLASYYELNEIEALYSFFESFKAYVRRNSNLNVDRKNSYFNMINFTKKLTKVNRKDPNKIEALKAEILETNNINSKEWLIEKLDELLLN